jgi:hypothetical protein
LQYGTKIANGPAHLSYLIQFTNRFGSPVHLVYSVPMAYRTFRISPGSQIQIDLGMCTVVNCTSLFLNKNVYTLTLYDGHQLDFLFGENRDGSGEIPFTPAPANGQGAVFFRPCWGFFPWGFPVPANRMVIRRYQYSYQKFVS